MSNDRLSIIIPAKGCKYLHDTVEDIFQKAVGDIEVIVMVDGEWPNPPLESHDNLIIVHRGSTHGIRGGVNGGARIASGEYIMKCDDHCMFGEGFDEILQIDCEPNWLVVPSRYSIDAEKWERTRGPINYMYMPFPYEVDGIPYSGHYGRKWRGKYGQEGRFWQPEKERRRARIDEIFAFQGSCYFMHKDYFFEIDCLDSEHYGTFYHEAQELTFKVWLSGGRVIRNKNTWYAHLFKRRHLPNISREQEREVRLWFADFWMNNKWPKQTRKFEWLVDKFWPMDGWPDDWQDPKYVEKLDE